MIDGTALDPIRKQYFLSATFRYDVMYFTDSGPGYATDMQWSCAPLTALGMSDAPVSIIDNRVGAADISDVAMAVRSIPGRLFVLTIVDPFEQHNEDGPYRELLFEMVTEPNVVYLSKYQPAEVTVRLHAAVGDARFLVLPYPYVASRVPTRPAGRRSPRVIFAGAINASVYPEREQLYRALRRQPWLRLLVRHLAHPGYPEIGDPVLHGHVGDKFVELLRRYRFMFVSGSRGALEFLKYRECAYAGCVPVGLPPATFDGELRDCILPVDPDNPWPALWGHLRTPRRELQHRAVRFAELQAESRNPGVLNRRLDAFLRPHLRRIAMRGI